MMMRPSWRLPAALSLALLFVIAPAASEEPPAPPSTTIPVTEADQLAFERYQLLGRLAAAQLDLLRLTNERTLAEEYAKLEQRFRDHYKVGVDQVERRGDRWILRTPPSTPPQ